MIEWVSTCDTGISSMTMWSALMGVKRKKDLNIPKDNSDFRRCYDMVEYGHVTLDELQVVKKQYSWFAPFVDNWKELSLLFEEELANACICVFVSYVKSQMLSGMRKRENFIMRGIFGII
jgi:hypothetical protein